MFWVITGHTMLWNLGLMSNFNEIPVRVWCCAVLCALLYVRLVLLTQRAQSIVGEFGMQLLWNAPFSVDSFFFLSGLLVAYLSYGAMKKGLFSWGCVPPHKDKCARTHTHNTQRTGCL